MATLPKVNVVIVGLGAGGAIMAKELCNGRDSRSSDSSGAHSAGPQDFQWDHDELKYEADSTC